MMGGQDEEEADMISEAGECVLFSPRFEITT